METKEEEATGAKVTVRFTGLGLDLEDAAGFVDAGKDNLKLVFLKIN